MNLLSTRDASIFSAGRAGSRASPSMVPVAPRLHHTKVPSRMVARSIIVEKSLGLNRPVRPVRPEDPWKAVIEAEKNGTALEAVVKSFNKGGLVVSVGPLKGFIPYNCMLSLKKGHTGDLDYLVGKTITTKIVSMQGNKREIILSEKKAQQSESMLLLKVGITVKGVVAAVEEYGAFCDLKDFPGVSGLIHKTEISWDTIMTVEEVLSKGQVIDCKIIDVDAAKCRLALSMKQLTEDPTKQTLDRVNWGVTRNLMLEVQDLVERLKMERGVDEVYIGRQAQERSVTSQELGVYLTREQVTDGFSVIARIGHSVQELLVTTKLERPEMKKALTRAAIAVNVSVVGSVDGI
eukprot:gene14328-20314_t